MSRLITTAIGKRFIPNELEGHETPASERDDYTYEVAIIFDSVIGYKEFNPNPYINYYHHKGPMTQIDYHNGQEYMILMPFRVFDQFYWKHYTEKTIMIKPN